VSAVLEQKEPEVSQNGSERLLDSFGRMGVVVAVDGHDRTDLRERRSL
jgi:hypothetical protein